jgi:hypothetical protein
MRSQVGWSSLWIADAGEGKEAEVLGIRLSTKLVVLLGQRWTPEFPPEE